MMVSGRLDKTLPCRAFRVLRTTWSTEEHSVFIRGGSLVPSLLFIDYNSLIKSMTDEYQKGKNRRKIK